MAGDKATGLTANACPRGLASWNIFCWMCFGGGMLLKVALISRFNLINFI